MIWLMIRFYGMEKRTALCTPVLIRFCFCNRTKYSLNALKSIHLGFLSIEFDGAVMLEHTHQIIRK